MTTEVLGISSYSTRSNLNDINGFSHEDNEMDLIRKRSPEEIALKRKIDEINDVISHFNVPSEQFEAIRKNVKNRRRVIAYEPIDLRYYLKKFVTTQLFPFILVILTAIWQICLFGLVVLLWIWEALIYPHKDEIIEKILYVILVAASWIWELLNAPLYIQNNDKGSLLENEANGNKRNFSSIPRYPETPTYALEEPSSKENAKSQDEPRSKQL